MCRRCGVKKKKKKSRERERVEFFDKTYKFDVLDFLYEGDVVSKKKKKVERESNFSIRHI